MTSRYHAFISYSQHSDRKLASAIQEGLRSLGASYLFRFRALEVFRDETAAGGKRGLKNKIYSGIDQSQFMILLANPDIIKQSTANDINWIEEEIKYWIATKHKVEFEKNLPITNLKIILCGTSGNIKWGVNDFDWSVTDCLPGTLRNRFWQLPEWIDFREIAVKSNTDATLLSLEHPVFKKKIAEVSAQIQGVTVDELIADDHRKKKIWRAFFIVIGLVLATLSVVTFNSSVRASKNEAEAIRQKDIAKKEERKAEAQRDTARAALRRDTLAKELEKAAKRAAEERRKDAHQQRASADKRRKEADQQRSVAEERRLEAERQRILTEDEALANAAYAWSDIDPTRAVNYALKVLDRNSNLTARMAIIKAFNTSSWLYSHEFENVYDADLSKDNKVLALTGPGNCRLVDFQSRKTKELNFQSDDVSILPSGKIIFSTPWQGNEGKGKMIVTDLGGNTLSTHQWDFNKLSVTVDGLVVAPVFENSATVLKILMPETGVAKEIKLPEGFDMLYGFYAYRHHPELFAIQKQIFGNDVVISRLKSSFTVSAPQDYEIADMELHGNKIGLYLLGKEFDAFCWLDLDQDNLDANKVIISLPATGDGERGGQLKFIDDDYVLAASTSGWIAIIDLFTRQTSIVREERATDRICISSSQDLLAIGKRSGDVFLYNKSGIKIGQLLGAAYSDALNSAFNTLRVSSDGQMLLTVNGKTLRIWQRPLFHLLSSHVANSGFPLNTTVTHFFDSLTRITGDTLLSKMDGRKTQKITNLGEVWYQFEVEGNSDFIHSGLTKDDLYLMRVNSEGTKNWGYNIGRTYTRYIITSVPVIRNLLEREMRAGRILKVDVTEKLYLNN